MKPVTEGIPDAVGTGAGLGGAGLVGASIVGVGAAMVGASIVGMGAAMVGIGVGIDTESVALTMQAQSLSIA